MVIERLQLSVCLSRSGRLFHTQRPPFAAAGGRKRLRYLLERALRGKLQEQDRVRIIHQNV